MDLMMRMRIRKIIRKEDLRMLRRVEREQGKEETTDESSV